MSSYWNPKPMRPKSENPIFEMVEDEPVVVKSLSPIETQRQHDGSPHTMVRGNSLPVGPELHVSEPVDKSQQSSQKEVLNPDAVVKAFMEKAIVDKDPDEAEAEEKKNKGVGDAAGKVAESALKTGGKAAARTVSFAGNKQ